jgi:hypothetical protein
MTVKNLILTAVLALAVVWVVALLLTMPTRATSGSGEGNILTTRGP